ncbi:MFS transporter [Sesbania bispinosa]|nr:MFS transporter [Sesbania bispinosa]
MTTLRCVCFICVCPHGVWQPATTTFLGCSLVTRLVSIERSTCATANPIDLCG